VFYERLLTQKEEEAIKYLAEISGPKYIASINVNSEEFKEFASIFASYKLCKNAIKGVTISGCDGVVEKGENLKKKIFKKSKIPENVEEFGYENMYSALPLTSAGENNGRKTTIDSTISDFYYLMKVYGHESGHHIIRKNEQLMDLMINSYDGEGYEESIIEETACNIFGDSLATYFAENHLNKDSKLKVDFVNSKRYFNKRYKDLQNQLERILKFYKEGKIEKVAQALEEEGLTAAELSLFNIYSGNKEISDSLEYLKNELGGRIFIELIDNLDNSTELEKAVKLVKTGIKDQKILEEKIGIYR